MHKHSHPYVWVTTMIIKCNTLHALQDSSSIYFKAMQLSTSLTEFTNFNWLPIPTAAWSHDAYIHRDRGIESPAQALVFVRTDRESK